MLKRGIRSFSIAANICVFLFAYSCSFAADNSCKENVTNLGRIWTISGGTAKAASRLGQTEIIFQKLGANRFRLIMRDQISQVRYYILQIQSDSERNLYTIVTETSSRLGLRDTLAL